MDIVADIRAAILAQMSTTLGADYQVLPFVFTEDRNDARRGKLAYNCRPLGASPSEGQVNRSFTEDQGFEMILSDTFAVDVTDVQKLASIDVMFDKADEIMKAIVSTKLGLSAVVLFVSSPSYSEPELLRGAKMVLLRIQFIVKYRTQIAT